MGDFATYDQVNNRYTLRGCIAAQETLPAATTVNPPFELSYWHFALEVAQHIAFRIADGLHLITVLLVLERTTDDSVPHI